MNRLTVLVLVLVCLIVPPAYAQNLCPNPGFEQLSGCPSTAGEINLAAPWTDAGFPTDLFSFCHVNGTPPGCNDVSVPVNFAGNSTAHGGSAYAGFYSRHAVPNQRTYMQAPLSSALVSGQLYKVTAYFRRSSNSKYSTNNLGIAFSTGPLAQAGGQYLALSPPCVLNNVVADTAGWTALNSFYFGSGLEDHIIIGNFNSDAATTSYSFASPVPACPSFLNAAFYYVDDVSVRTITEQLSVTGDTLICTGESTTLTGVINTEGWWSLQTTPNDTIPSLNNSITINPAVNTTYLWNGIINTLQVTVSVSAPPVVTLPADTTVCDDTAVLLDATNSNSTYLWSTGATTPQLMATDSGYYSVAVNNGFCTVTDTFMLSVLNTPDVYLGESAMLCTDNDETVTFYAGPGTSYLWQPGGDTTALLTVSQPGIYSVQVNHANGCSKSDTVVVTEVCTETLFVPGAFTPNRDGKNDLFYADGTNILSYKIIIFNRWGQPVYTSNTLGATGGWNGTDRNSEVPEGLYTYAITYEALKTNGKIKKDNKYGYFMLFR